MSRETPPNYRLHDCCVITVDKGPSQEVLDKIIKSLPNGIHYYIVTPDDKAIDGPWDKEEIGKRFAACTVEGAEIAYWCDQTWVRRLHYYHLVDRAQPFRGVKDFTGVKDD